MKNTTVSKHHSRQPIFYDAGLHTLLCYYYDKVPVVQSETRVMEYFTIQFDGKTRHYFTHREAEKFLHVVLDEDDPEDAKLLAQGVQRHYGPIDIYSFEYDDTILENSPHDEYIEPIKVLRALRSVYAEFFKAENSLAQIFGFPSLHIALQHDVVQTLLSMYEPDELIHLYTTEVQPRLEHVQMLQERFHDAVEQDIFIPTAADTNTTKSLEDFDHAMITANTATASLSQDFLTRVYENIAQEVRKHGAIPLPWVIHAGDDAVDYIVSDINTTLSKTLTSLKNSFRPATA